MKFRNDIDIEQLRQTFRLDETTGRLYWRPRFVKTKSDRTWNTRFAGKEAGTFSNGYRQVCINYRLYKVHRVMFAMYHGHWPKGEVDHSDRNGLNNTDHMLRDATHAENQRNAKLKKTNLSGTKGVCWDRSRKRWIAYIDANGRIPLGRFMIKEDAIAAVTKARLLLHGEFARDV